MVAGGHKTTILSYLNYLSVLSWESVSIYVKFSVLNSLKVIECDIHNIRLTAKCRDKIWTVVGPEFGYDLGKFMPVVREFYGLNSCGESFRAILA